MNLPEILDDLAARFIIPHAEEINGVPERIFFMIEEAHWFYLDIYQKKYRDLPRLTLKKFGVAILEHIGYIIDVYEAYKTFIKYKKDVPVYGALLINREMDSILLVRGYSKHSMYSFPKGKKNRDESGEECAVREVYEEIGYDIGAKILPITLKSNKFTLFVVMNVKGDTKFKTQTRNEISDIRWIKLSEIERNKNGIYKNIAANYGIFWEIKNIIENITKNHFRFDKQKINKCFI
ncbi:mRNA decapping complex subunit 2 [Astathelohania contejeani]|uniref:mRNA decapping complex subunit 2 n=1 Tax=Astathelohania contejeani TaxID=164912 RepID=A0ABQ7HXM6_9MICR|nr:mRNA decapping complex subunit 2 [Thelohania contejeani]